MPLLLKYRAIEWIARFLMPSDSQTISAQRASLVEAAQPGVITGSRREIQCVADSDMGGVSVRRYRPRIVFRGTLVFFHGGGWTQGDSDSHDLLIRALAVATCREVVSVNYRRPPEHPFPAAYEDCLTVVRLCLEENVAGRVVVCGDSAGGNLAAAVAQAFPSGTLTAQVLIYPVVDLTSEAPSYALWGDSALCTMAEMRASIAAYVPNPSARMDPAVSPLLAGKAALATVCPAYVLLAECDPLHDEGLAYYEALCASTDGPSKHTLDDVKGVPHAFLSMLGLQEGRDAVARIAAWLKPRWE